MNFNGFVIITIAAGILVGKLDLRQFRTQHDPPHYDHFGLSLHLLCLSTNLTYLLLN